MRNATKGVICALTATALWSGNFIISRLVANDIPPLQLNFWRWVVAIICIAPFVHRHFKNDWPAIRIHWKYLSIMGILGITAMNPLIYKAGQSTESLNMALLVPTAPIVIMLLSRIFYGEAITKRRITGLFTVLLGVGVVVSRGDLERLASVQFTAGDFWALAGATVFATYSFLMRKRTNDISAVGFNTATFVLGTLYSIPLVIAEAMVMPPAHFHTPVIVSILYSGVGCSMLAFWLWTTATDNIGPVYAGFLYYLLPLFTAIGSILILNEQITPAHVIGGACIIGGIIFASWPKAAQRTDVGA